MSKRLTDIAALPSPGAGSRIHYDAPTESGKGWVPGFGVRITKAGAKAFILNYRTKAGRERRLTIGTFPLWTLAAAREEAALLKRRIDVGEDPLGEIKAKRSADTVGELCERFINKYLPKKRASTAKSYEGIIRKHIKPALGGTKVADVTATDVDRLHRKITDSGSSYAANRTVAVLSKMFNLAIRDKLRPDNPVMGVERNPESKRLRYLSDDEQKRLRVALAGHRDRQAADIIRLLLLTGARRGEMLAAQWDQFSQGFATWTKPGATTKQKTDHSVPLPPEARLLLADLHKASGDSAYLFPGRLDGHRLDIKDAWHRICKAAKITGCRVHDLRHTYASNLASRGYGLHTIGALLGHTTANTTHRYAHLTDASLREAVENVGTTDNVFPMKGGRR